LLGTEEPTDNSNDHQDMHTMPLRACYSMNVFESERGATAVAPMAARRACRNSAGTSLDESTHNSTCILFLLELVCWDVATRALQVRCCCCRYVSCSVPPTAVLLMIVVLAGRSLLAVNYVVAAQASSEKLNSRSPRGGTLGKEPQSY
jgi:hypothetical protein